MKIPLLPRGLSVVALLLLTRVALADAKPTLLIVYFLPKDQRAIPGYVERLDRVMTSVQDFYREATEAAGYGPMTFDLARGKEGRLEVHVVQGKEPIHAYGRKESSKVRAEVVAALESKGLSANDRTLLIFEALLEWQDGKTVEVGPYAGVGNHLAGTAWVYDDALLDPRQLGSKAPGGYYAGSPCSIGAFNSHYIGGVSHELGHALGLPHVAGPSSSPKHSLMADGNHTYGEELRGEGAGTYLHPASAMLLAKCRPFVGEIDGATLPVACEMDSLKASFGGARLVLTGRLAAKPPAFGAIAYNALLNDAEGYGTKGWISEVDSSGRFQLSVADLQRGTYQMRLQVCHTNGPTSDFFFDYNVNSFGVPDLTSFSRAAATSPEGLCAWGEKTS